MCVSQKMFGLHRELVLPSRNIKHHSFATTNASTLESLRVYLGYWSAVAPGIAPPANQTAKLIVNTTMSTQFGIANHTTTLWRIDETHANPLKAFLEMGSPTSPSSTQLARLKSSSIVLQNKCWLWSPSSQVSVQLWTGWNLLRLRSRLK